MMIEDGVLEIPLPKSNTLLSNADILFGQYIPPIDRLKIVSPDEFEECILEWVHGYLNDKYFHVRRSGGAGDQGRDIIAYISENKSEWDNYQCKHYNSPLAPSDIWTELGKLIYYTFTHQFSIPRNYYFVSPHGIGTKLGNLIDEPIGFREELKSNWITYCKSRITKTKEIELDNNLKAYIDEFDFSIVKSVEPLDLIEQHSKTKWHAPRFGGGLVRHRPNIQYPTEQITNNEIHYVEQLLEAYSDHLKCPLSNVNELKQYPSLFSHFNRQRESFFSAESLKEFARDSLPDNLAFEELENEIYDGVIDIACLDYQDGYRRVIETIQEAKRIQISSNILVLYLHVKDKSGICHHLANKDRLKWVIR